MKDLLIYLKSYRKESMVAPLFKLLEACFELIVPAVMAKIIDIGIQNGDTAYILRMGLLLILFGLVGLLCSATAQYFAAKAAYGFGTALRKDFFRHVNRLSFAELDKIGTSALITRITGDINQVQSGVNLVLRLFLRSPFIVLGALIAAFLGAVLCELCLTHFWRFPLMRTHAARLCLWGIIAMMVPDAELAAFAGGAGAGALCSWICHLRERRDPRFVHTLAASLLLAAGMFVIAWF